VSLENYREKFSEWNEKWQGKRARNWTDLSMQLMVLKWNEDITAHAFLIEQKESD